MKCKIVIWLLFFIILNTGCQTKTENSLYTIKMIRIDGVTIVETFNLPDDAMFFIQGDRGNWSLTYNTPVWGGIERCHGEIKPAIISYVVLSKKTAAGEIKNY